MATTSETLALAMQHHQSGRLQEAEPLYRLILQSNPNHADALHLLGLIAHQVGNRPAAVEYICRAIQLNGNAADAHGNLGLAYYAWRKLPEAIASYRRALKLKPNDAKVWMTLGVALKDQREFDEAVACYRRAIEIHPGFTEAHGNLGNSLKELGRLDEAIESYLRVLELNPNIAQAHCNLGIALQEQGRFDEAIARYRRALDLKPNYAEAHGNLGLALKGQGLLDESVACFRRTVELQPNTAEAHGNLGIALMEQGYPDEAIVCYRRALELRPDDAVSLGNLGNALTNRGKLTEAVSCFRRSLELSSDDAVTHSNLGNALKDQGLLDEAIACFRRSLELNLDYAIAHSNLLMTLHYCDGMTHPALAEAHAEFDRQHTSKLMQTVDSTLKSNDLHRRPRLGFVSADLGRHPVGFFLVRVLENLFASQYEMICYSDRNVKDDLSQRMQSVSTHWRDVLGVGDQRLAEQIRADGIDILFDLAGHTGHNRLMVFARKPAPIQVSWIGYEGTTGLSAMDYLIADRHTVPNGSEVYYRESVLRMPDGYLCYEPPDTAPPIAPPPSQKNGYMTFGSFNNLAKVTPHVVKVWSEILHRCPNSRLLMKYSGLGDPNVRQRYLDAFAAHGVNPQRLELLPPCSYAEYLASYADVDVILDPFPFSGSTTTCEALWMGVPVVTCPLETFASRHSLSHLSSIGVRELVAENLKAYVELAVSLAGDLPRVTSLRGELRDRMRTSPLCDGKRFAANLDTLLQSIWSKQPRLRMDDCNAILCESRLNE